MTKKEIETIRINLLCAGYTEEEAQSIINIILISL